MFVRYAEHPMKELYRARTANTTASPAANTQGMANLFSKIIALLFTTLIAFMGGVKAQAQTAAQSSMSATSPSFYTTLNSATSVTASAAADGYFKGIRCKLFYLKTQPNFFE